MIDEKQLIKEIKEAANTDRYEGYVPAAVLFEVIDMIREQPVVGEWIPFTADENGMLDCALPNDEEEILVSDGVTTWKDTFMRDEGCYLARWPGKLIGRAWQPLPEPWEGEKNDR